MVRRGVGRVTAKDIAKAGDVEALIKQLVRQAADGDAEAKQDAAAALASMSTQSHNAHAKALFRCGCDCAAGGHRAVGHRQGPILCDRGAARPLAVSCLETQSMHNESTI